jgi:hypothetical protein
VQALLNIEIKITKVLKTATHGIHFAKVLWLANLAS